MIEYLALPALAHALTDPAAVVEIDGRFIGLLERRDAWQVGAWPLPWQVLFLVHEGCCTVTCDGTTLAARAGEAVLLRADRVNGVRFSQVLRYSELRFRVRRGGADLAPEPPVLIVPHAHELTAELDRCVAAALRSGDGAAGAVLRHRLALLLAHSAAAAPAAEAPAFSAMQREQLQAWCAKHLAHHPTPADLAAQLGYQPDYFSRLFRASYGLSPRAWLVAERMRAACRLLRDGRQPVTAVAAQLGYASTSHFCRQFGKLIGCKPLVYRRRDPRPVRQGR